MKLSIIILLISFIADQLLQLKSVRQTKHKDSWALFLHVIMWSFVMFALSAVIAMKTENMNILLWWAFITFNHFIIEWCCIRMWTHHYYNKNKSLMVFWILLEQILMNVSMIYLFETLIY